MMGPQQGRSRRRIQEIPIPDTEEVLGTTAGAMASGVPLRGNFHPARGCDAMRGRVAAQQRVQLLRQSERLQRQRVQIQLQEVELELQRRQVERQRVQLGRQRRGQAPRQVSQAAPSVFWGPGGLLMPVS